VDLDRLSHHDQGMDQPVAAAARRRSVVAVLGILVAVAAPACTGDGGSPSPGSGAVVTGSTQSGSTPTATGPASCRPVPGQSTTNDGSGDFAPLPPGGRGKSEIPEYPSGSTDEILSHHEAFAVLQVVSRGGPAAIADPRLFGARPSRPHPPPGTGESDFEVIRPARFAVVRPLKGTIPDCLDLDVPGGTVGSLSSDGFAPAFGVGDRMLAFVNLHDDRGAPAPWVNIMLVADEHGLVTLPFGAHDRLNVDTWVPSAAALSPPPGRPARS
jgi:hypothetical protein